MLGLKTSRTSRQINYGESKEMSRPHENRAASPDDKAEATLPSTTSRPRSPLRTAGTVALCFALAVSLCIQTRYAAVALGLHPSPQAQSEGMPSAVRSSETQGAFSVTAKYCSEVVASRSPSNPDGRTSTNLLCDDGWFFANPRIYNHQLATSCAVLSAVCNSESQFYGSIEGSAPYAEEALESLGFSNVCTQSYALRSHIFDQIGALFTGSHDVAAYTFASKDLTSPDGSRKTTLVFVGIRGSYGIEWLSNLKLADESNSDHTGFKAAETEIAEMLERYLEEQGTDADHTTMLITGHSRGASIANLLAADLDNRSARNDGSALVNADSLHAYTFAAPGSTRSDARSDDEYKNIFNIVNESDIVTQLPLSTWGYGRYGTNVALPDATSEGFTRSFARMQDAFRRNTGFSDPCDSAASTALASFAENMGHVFPTPRDVINPTNALAAAHSLAQINVAYALSSHCPDTYIAWMQSTDPDDLTFRN